MFGATLITWQARYIGIELMGRVCMPAPRLASTRLR
jgi:hypothetical protein